MLEEEVDDHLAGVDFAVDFSDEPWSEVLISAWPGVTAANDL